MSTHSGITADSLKSTITEQLQATYVQVDDLSAGCGQMFEVIIVSPSFSGLRLLARHKLVNEKLKDEISKVHAFSQIPRFSPSAMASWMVNGLQLGIQDALMGIKMVAKNPRLRQQKFLYIFLILTLLSLVLLGVTHLLVTLPLRLAKYILQHYPTATDTSQVDNLLVSAHRIIRDVFSYVPVVALMFMRYVYPKPLDDLFMETLRYIDQVNGGVYSYSGAMATRSYRKEYWPNMKSYIFRTWKKVCLGLMILLLSLLPTVGPFVIPLAGAYTAWRSLGGDIQAIVAVGIGFLILPRWTTFRLVRVLLGMRTLMRELLEPYFVRMGMSHSEKKRWFKGRSNVLFGFSVIAYLLIRIPYLGFVGYGVAQAAAAYMLTTMVTADEINRSSSKLNVESLKIAAKD